MLPLLLIGGASAGAYFFEDEFEEIADDFSKVFGKTIQWTVSVISTLLGAFWKNLSPMYWGKRAFFGVLNIALNKEVMTFWMSALMISFSFISARKLL